MPEWLVGLGPDWLVAIGTLALAFLTLVLAVIAVFQDRIRARLSRPELGVRIKTDLPDCGAVPVTEQATGKFIGDCMYLHLWVTNEGNVGAKNVEVYAVELRRQRVDTTWDPVRTFPPMNLRWAHIHTIFFPSIAPDMGKHCDFGHITDPKARAIAGEENPRLGLTQQQASLAFDVIAPPNHKGHIIGPGLYRLDIEIAAENAGPVRKTVEIDLKGPWYADEAKMLADGFGVRVL